MKYQVTGDNLVLQAATDMNIPSYSLTLTGSYQTTYCVYSERYK